MFILILRSLESVNDVIEKHSLRSRDKTAKEVDTNDKIFIQRNGFPSGYKGTGSFLKTAS